MVNCACLWYEGKVTGLCGAHSEVYRKMLEREKRSAPTRNSEVLEDFVNYCKTNSQLRFWQALLNWSRVGFILRSSHPAAYIHAETRVLGSPVEKVELEDTYFWEGKNS